MFSWGLRRMSRAGRINSSRPASGPVIGKEVITMLEAILNFLLAVAAGVIGTYICKWLDDHSKGD